MSESEIGERVKYSISIEMEVPSYESTRYLPDSLVVRFDKMKVQTNEVTQTSEQLVRTGNDMLGDKIKPVGKLDYLLRYLMRLQVKIGMKSRRKF